MLQLVTALGALTGTLISLVAEGAGECRIFFLGCLSFAPVYHRTVII